jgi:3-hydroxybutyryl-CoA dehydrogenase
LGVSTVGVVGAGFMGSGIAASSAFAGKEVLVYEPDEAPLARAREWLADTSATAVARGRLTADEAAQVAERVGFTTHVEDLRRADAVIEAVVEDPVVKGDLFEQLDAVLPDARFLASNTSSIPIGLLAARTARPERVLGMHFFSPVTVMKLVEVVAAVDTGATALDAAEAFARDIGKQPIRAKDRSGFVVNLLLVPYLMAAVRMFDEGFASREDIDSGMKLGCGHPMGPLELSDFIGLDVLAAVCDSLYDEFKRPEYGPPPLLRRMVSAGHLGRKAGEGFYTYAPVQRASEAAG